MKGNQLIKRIAKRKRKNRGTDVIGDGGGGGRQKRRRWWAFWLHFY
jgi:hypothetical protein